MILLQPFLLLLAQDPHQSRSNIVNSVKILGTTAFQENNALIQIYNTSTYSRNIDFTDVVTFAFTVCISHIFFRKLVRVSLENFLTCKSENLSACSNKILDKLLNVFNKYLLVVNNQYKETSRRVSKFKLTKFHDNLSQLTNPMFVPFAMLQTDTKLIVRKYFFLGIYTAKVKLNLLVKFN